MKPITMRVHRKNTAPSLIFRFSKAHTKSRFHWLFLHAKMMPEKESGPVYLISACLLGISCRYDGTHRHIPTIRERLHPARLVPICPEVLGGLPTPRPPGILCRDMLQDSIKIVTKDSSDLTREYLLGAMRSLDMAKSLGADKAVLKAESPSCGKNVSKTNYVGITAGIFTTEGIKVLSEEEI